MQGERGGRRWARALCGLRFYWVYPVDEVRLLGLAGGILDLPFLVVVCKAK